MKYFLTMTGKFGLLTVVFALFTVSAMAQAGSGNIKLRRAVDTDGDNKADFSVFRPSNNAWYIYKSNGSGYTAQQFGLATEDFLTPGDYDGDGKGDIAVWRDTTGAWYWLNSSDNTFHGAYFGVPSDEPVARDYDGDGKTDLAVVRRTGTQLYWY